MPDKAAAGGGNAVMFRPIGPPPQTLHRSGSHSVANRPVASLGKLQVFLEQKPRSPQMKQPRTHASDRSRSMQRLNSLMTPTKAKKATPIRKPTCDVSTPDMNHNNNEGENNRTPVLARNVQAGLVNSEDSSLSKSSGSSKSRGTKIRIPSEPTDAIESPIAMHPKTIIRKISAQKSCSVAKRPTNSPNDRSKTAVRIPYVYVSSKNNSNAPPTTPTRPLNAVNNSNDGSAIAASQEKRAVKRKRVPASAPAPDPAPASAPAPAPAATPNASTQQPERRKLGKHTPSAVILAPTTNRTQRRADDIARRNSKVPFLVILGDDDPDFPEFELPLLPSSKIKAQNPRSKKRKKTSKPGDLVEDVYYDSRVFDYDEYIGIFDRTEKEIRTNLRNGKKRHFLTEEYIVKAPTPIKVTKGAEQRARTRIGRSYQATISNLGDAPTSEALPPSAQIWDPHRADLAEKRGENIQGFLSQAVELVHTEFLMELLHVADYSISTAMGQLVQLRKVMSMPTSHLNRQQAETVNRMVSDDKTHKDFVNISKKVKRSTTDCMIQYYRWKGSETQDYLDMKYRWRSDYCYFCKDGGNLIVCDACERAFHTRCLDPPLKRIPAGEWFCGDCSALSESQRREKIRKKEARAVTTANG
mmetsp:Transcript_26604/g.74439  ORF Transcript_26604/g.74439 Transcript_26604/m.74439 type:complete len:641 (+) Transcript_26604:83-2005(+)